ncbi:hypothetical protein DM02DRAFT_652024 [Periconia macrospinosa]|uniref:Uncharacterized protein n=1 Tax=Periconia macrospinosa TaxID=97972 RepID=A0A2V1E3I6_9PLEO|nr:hypothetical protein DM02DRAFT_652024 [Periconia macrospinosa]
MRELEIAYAAGVLADAALDTTGQKLEMFIMAEVKHPERVHKAHQELGIVIRSERMPEIEDDEYNGYRIPAGCIVIGSHCSIHMDAKV